MTAGRRAGEGLMDQLITSSSVVGLNNARCGWGMATAASRSGDTSTGGDTGGRVASQQVIEEGGEVTDKGGEVDQRVEVVANVTLEGGKKRRSI